ncbi:MAG: S16 family serine protease [Clostridia bacterium]
MNFWEWLIIEVVLIAGIIACVAIKKNKKCDCSSKPIINGRDDRREIKDLAKMRETSLSEPLSEHVRPKNMRDIIGQDDGIMALRATLCGKNPQHILIYGPPGVGKTCAARLVLEEAKKSPGSPFNENSAFIEIDATCVRFDERSIADPLLGSVHDPIYQGAGALGQMGIPQPKPGAVSRAHCGVLFLDEIGELHPMQMNKLLKVLEDRRVFFESSYYSKDNSSIPSYIHDIFQNGMPADFRLIGATTRSPEEIPAALRSRCVELFFSPLNNESLEKIAKNAVSGLGGGITRKALADTAMYSRSGRDAVNIIELSSEVAALEKRMIIEERDIDWVARTCRFVKKYKYAMTETEKVGVSFGLGVSASEGSVFEIECTVSKKRGASGTLNISGAIFEEEIDAGNRKLKRQSTVMASVSNVVAAIERCFSIDCASLDILFNIVGGIPVDGPSAGAAFCLALMSAITKRPPRAKTALTGEVSLLGTVHAIGGLSEKVKAAAESGAKFVIYPLENSERIDSGIKLIKISTVEELINFGLTNKQPVVLSAEKENVIAALPASET